MQFGIFSNGERNNTIAADSYDEDLYEVRLADRLGFQEAWISEHLRGTHGGRPDALSAADLFICKAATLTKRIRLGPGVRPIALYHPIQVALEAAVCDHLTRGRYLFGFGVGLPHANDIGQRGLGEDSIPLRRARMHESIDFILKCWSATEPFDYEGEFWQGKNIRVVPKPYTRPHMPIGVASRRTLGTMELAARNGFIPLLSQYDNTEHMRDHAEGYLRAGAEAGCPTQRGDIRACRFVYVSDSVKKAKEELRPTITASVLRHVREFPHYYQKFLPPSGQLEDITWDHLVDTGFFFVGDPDTVYQRILQHYEESGGCHPDVEAIANTLGSCPRHWGAPDQFAGCNRDLNLVSLNECGEIGSNRLDHLVQSGVFVLCTDEDRRMITQSAGMPVLLLEVPLEVKRRSRPSSLSAEQPGRRRGGYPPNIETARARARYAAVFLKKQRSDATALSRMV